MTRRPPADVIEAPGPEVLFGLHKHLSDGEFEELCCALWYEDVEVRNPELYGQVRRRQFGIDVIADRSDGKGRDVLSCKRYKTLQKGHIPTFANDFLKHWDSHWKAQNIQRFILCVACDVKSHERRKEIEVEEARFAQLGVKFEVWGQRALSNRLHRNPGVRDVFFPPPAQKYYPPVAPSGRAGMLYTAAEVTQIGRLQSTIQSQIAAQLDRCQRELNAGASANVGQQLRDIRSDEGVWTSLEASLQARVLRMQAFIAIDDDLNVAEALLGDADGLSPPKEPLVRALLTFHQHGPLPALEILGAPMTKDGVLLRAGLLIEAQRLEDAEAILQTWIALKDVDAEWHRLKAFLAFNRGDRDGAVEAMRKAEALAPTSALVTESSARLLYWAAMAPEHTPLLAGWPEPSDIEYMRQDARSQDSLREALRRFERLLGQPLDARWSNRLEIWRIACLAALSERDGQAQAHCLKLIAREPLSPIATFWGVARGYDVDLKATIRRLEVCLRDEPTIEHLQAAAICAIAADDLKKAAAVLKRYADRFSDEHCVEVIERWRSRVVLLQGKSLSADARVDPLDELQWRVNTASKGGDWRPVVALLDNPQIPLSLLLNGCKLLAAATQWELIPPYLDRLLPLNTPEVVRLAAYTWYNLRAFKKVIGLLEQRKDTFYGAILPYALARLKAQALGRSGELRQAIVDAISLARSSGVVEDQLHAIDLSIQGGDIVRAVPLLREVIDEHGWTARQLLRFVPSISTEDPELARRLLRKALTAGLGVADGGLALQWCDKLGLTQEVAELGQRLFTEQQSSEVKVLRTASFEEVLEYLRQTQASRLELERRYRRGEAPVHLVANVASVNLADIWRNAFTQSRGPLLIRSGNRPADLVSSGAIPEPVALYADLTALLTIGELGLLDVLDRCQLSLVLPHTALAALNTLEQQAHNDQPERMQLLQQLTRSVIHRTTRLLEPGESFAPGSAARIVFEKDVPEPSATIAALPQLSLRSLAEHLVAIGSTPPETMDAIRGRGAWGAEVSEVSPAQPRTLIFEGSAMDALVDSPLFEVAQRHYVLAMDAEHHRQCLAQLEQLEQTSRLAAHLRQLRIQLAAGIQAGRYTVLPEPSPDQLRLQRGSPWTAPEMQPVAELIGLSTTPGVWIWVDDRYFTSFASINQNPIVSTFEVLEHLRLRRGLTEADYYRFISSLRRAGAQIVPVTEDEVLSALRLAPLNKEEVIETTTLRELRRSFNQTLSLEPELDLDMTVKVRQRPPEVPCLMEALRLANRCLTRIWETATLAMATRIAWSDWVWSTLRVEHLSRLPPDGSREQQLGLWRMLIGQLLLLGLSLPTTGNKDSVRHAFFEWLEARLIDLTSQGDVAALEEFSAMTRQILTQLLSTSGKTAMDVPVATLRALAATLVGSLPDDLREKLYEDDAFRDSLKPHLRTIVNVGELQFEDESFWSTLAQSQAGREATVTTLNGQRLAVSADGTSVDLEGETASVSLSNIELVLLSEDVEVRRQMLREHRWQIEIADVDLDAEIERIATLPSVAERVRTFKERRERTAAGRYALVEDLPARWDIPLEFLLPLNTAAHLYYLGLHAEDAAIDWDRVARRMLSRYGLIEVLRRWSGLPIALPSAILEQVAGFEEGEQATLRQRLADRSTPLLALKVLALTAHAAPASAAVGDQIAQLFERWPSQARAFIELLHWAERVWDTDGHWRALTPSLRLACVWSHADRVFASLLAKGITAESIARHFHAANQSGFSALLRFDRAYESDIAWPRWASAETLLLQGVNAALPATAQPTFEAQRAAWLALLTKSIESKHWPRPRLFEDRRAGGDALGSFFAQPIQAWLAGEEFADLQVLSPEARDAILALSMQRIEDAVQEGGSWLQLLTVGPQWLPAEALRQVDAAVQRYQFPAGALGDHDVPLLLGLTATIPYLEPNTRQHLAEGALAWARRLHAVYGERALTLEGESDIGRDASHLTQVTVYLARRKTLDEAFPELSALMIRMVEAWPALAQAWRPVLDRVFRECPSREAHVLWPAYVRMRAET